MSQLRNRSQWSSHIEGDFVQIDLGKVRSLEKHQALAKNVDLKQVPKGVELLDEDTAKNSEYELLLIGRKLNKDEQDIEEYEGEGTEVKHFINKQMFHEADMSKIDKGVKKNEGIFKYYSRNFYKVYLLYSVLGLLTLFYWYKDLLNRYYEDYVDSILYINFKRGRTNSYIIQSTYMSNVSSKRS